MLLSGYTFQVRGKGNGKYAYLSGPIDVYIKVGYKFVSHGIIFRAVPQHGSYFVHRKLLKVQEAGEYQTQQCIVDEVLQLVKRLLQSHGSQLEYGLVGRTGHLALFLEGIALTDYLGKRMDSGPLLNLYI